ncbi:MAG: EamA family transporter [Chloroflexi bacterium]|nr:EamA family transporter [Chloroflexota bacterium]
MSTSRAPISPWLVLFGGILAVSTASIFIRWAQNDAPSLVIAAYRLGLSSLVLGPWVGWRYRRVWRILDARAWGLALGSGAFLAAHFATWITSLEYTTVASSVVLVTTTPLWVALVGAWLLDESLTPGLVVGLALALVGSVIIGLGDVCAWDGGLQCHELVGFGARALWGDILALMGAWAAAGYLLIGRALRKRTPLLMYITLTYSVAAVLLLLTVAVLRLPLIGYPARTYGWFLALALVPQLMGHSAFNWALRYLPASVVSVSLLGEPVGASLLAYILLHEVPSWLTLMGGALVLTGIVQAARSAPEPAQEAVEEVLE